MSKNNFTFKVEWDDQLIEKIVREGGKQAVKEGAETILKKANSIAPYDTGKLVGSGGVSVDENGGNVYYTAEYAGIVHERPSSKSKWLEKTVNSSGGEVLKAFQKGLSNEM